MSLWATVKQTALYKIGDKAPPQPPFRSSHGPAQEDGAQQEGLLDGKITSFLVPTLFQGSFLLWHGRLPLGYASWCSSWWGYLDLTIFSTHKPCQKGLSLLFTLIARFEQLYRPGYKSKQTVTQGPASHIPMRWAGMVSWQVPFSSVRRASMSIVHQ